MMELEDLLTLAASSLLGGIMSSRIDLSGRVVSPTREEITAAVRTAHEIWKETLRQQREG